MTDRAAVACLLATGALVFAPIWLQGEVIAPHDNRAELGLPPNPEARPSNRILHDWSSTYLPSLQLQLTGDSDGWLPTWNPHAELGRPAAHVSGFSRAFPLTRLLAPWVRDPLQLFTALSLSGIALAGLAGFGLLRALGLHPAAALVGAVTLSLGVFPAFWLSFPMFTWGVGWTAAAAWAVVRSLARPSLANGVALAFCLYGLLLSGYPQQIVYHGYGLVGFAGFGLWRVASPRERATRVAHLLAAVLVATACAAPVYLDLALTAQRSGRLAADPSFFAASLPDLSDFGDVARYAVTSFDPFWLGHPALPGYPVAFAGISATPLVAALLVVSARVGRTPGLRAVQMGVALCIGLTIWPPLFALAVEYLGLGVSRFLPLAAGALPVAALAAYASDHVIRRGLSRRLALAAGAPLAAALVAAAADGVPMRLVPVFVACLLTAATLAFLITRHPALGAVVACAGALYYAPPLLLTRPETDVARTSPLVRALRHETRGGGRYALFGATGALLPSNQEVLTELRSVHTYNSLSSRAYQEWTLEVSDRGAHTRGRVFRSLDSSARLGDPAFALAGVEALVATRSLEHAGSPARYAATHFPGVLRTVAPPLLEARVDEFEPIGTGSARIRLEDARSGAALAHRTLDRDDQLRIALTPAPDQTLLFVSQQYHPHWRAHAGDEELTTVAVNGLFQGVVVPPDTTSVELRFLPNARYAGWPHVLFGALAALVAIRALGRRGRGGLSVQAESPRRDF